MSLSFNGKKKAPTATLPRRSAIKQA